MFLNDGRLAQCVKELISCIVYFFLWEVSDDSSCRPLSTTKRFNTFVGFICLFCIGNIFLSCDFYILLYNATGLPYKMSKYLRQGRQSWGREDVFFKIYSEDNLQTKRMRQVGKEQINTPICYNILEEQSYSRPLKDVMFNETSVGESIKIDPEVCLDWRKGRRVVELSLLADTMFCVMCLTRLHLCDTINETKQGTGSVLKLNVQTLCAMPQTTFQQEQGMRREPSKFNGRLLLVRNCWPTQPTLFYLCHSLNMNKDLVKFTA